MSGERGGRGVFLTGEVVMPREAGYSPLVCICAGSALRRTHTALLWYSRAPMLATHEEVR